MYLWEEMDILSTIKTKTECQLGVSQQMRRLTNVKRVKMDPFSVVKVIHKRKKPEDGEECSVPRNKTHLRALIETVDKGSYLTELKRIPAMEKPCGSSFCGVSFRQTQDLSVSERTKAREEKV